VGQRPDEIRERTIVVRVPHAGDAMTERETDPNVQDEADSSYDDATAAAREDIEMTRADMTSTIEAIQGRLDPEVLSEQAKDTAHDVTDYAIREAKEAAREITDHALEQAREAVRDVTGQAKLALREATVGKVEEMARNATDTAGGWRQGLMDTVKANPMPAALVGLGVSWLLLNRPSSSSESPAYTGRAYGAGMVPGYRSAGYPSPDFGGSSNTGSGLGGAAQGAQQAVSRVTDRTQARAGEMVDQVQDTAGGVLDQVQGAASDAMGQVQETGGQVIDQVQEQASRAQGFLQRQLEENPLIVGAVAVAVGGVLAGTVRSTSREDQLLGATRDRVMHAAQEVTQETIQKVGKVVDEAQTAATDEAKKQDLVGGSESSTH